MRGWREYPLLPTDVELLQGILDRELRIKGLKSESDEADMLAAALIELYQSGIRDPDKLQEMLKAC
ncbi:hypothetical protein SAMCCGM7_pC0192 (plasmid) [Sinorhizobium americanum CCGM7]|uniref:hypothetical protein n=1 Tax=Sinorhizobium americanum TaxID=194963 RepID=UPI0004D3430B|nr:hypothetical protein [Sinorhizobium americanum]APG87397.1 hypothetical protein SAMCCGM7_pC0192 [Sinorhizobium americanum CCGM7]